VSDLEKRLETLERSAGGACPKCSGVLVTVVNGKMRSATRCGEPIGPAARAEFEASGSRCSACGAGFLEIRVPPEIPGRQYDAGMDGEARPRGAGVLAPRGGGLRRER